MVLSIRLFKLTIQLRRMKFRTSNCYSLLLLKCRITFKWNTEKIFFCHSLRLAFCSKSNLFCKVWSFVTSRNSNLESLFHLFIFFSLTNYDFAKSVLFDAKKTETKIKLFRQSTWQPFSEDLEAFLCLENVQNTFPNETPTWLSSNYRNVLSLSCKWCVIINLPVTRIISTLSINDTELTVFRSSLSELVYRT